MSEQEKPEFMTTEELAAYLRTKPSSVRHWRTTGDGPEGVRLGRRVLYLRSDVEAWIASERDAERARH